MKIKEINTNGIVVYFAPCVVIAASIGDTDRQTATYFAERLSTGELIEEVVFDTTAVDESEAAEIYASADWESRSTDWDDLATVAFADGTTPRDYLIN